MLKIPATSKEYLDIPVAAADDVDLSGLPVEIALIAPGSDPDAGDWKTATWHDGHARILIGPGGALQLEQHHTYIPWVRITATPEIPVLRSTAIRTW